MTAKQWIAAARIAALGVAGVAAIVSGEAALAAGYASLAEGREVFDRVGCNSCHSYVSRRSAPSVRDLQRDFSGDPVAIANATRSSSAHKDDPRLASVAEGDLQSIAQWLGGISWPEPESAETAAPTAEIEAATVAVAAPVAAIEPVVAAAPVAAAELPRVAIAAIRLEKGKARTDRLIVDLKGGEPDMVDMRMIDDSLVVSFAGVRLDPAVPAQKDTWPGSRVLSSVSAVDRAGEVDLTIRSRVAAWTYTGMQGKRRLAIELTADAKQPAAKKSAAAKTPLASKPKTGASDAGAKTKTKPVLLVAKAAAAATTSASSAAASTAASGSATAGTAVALAATSAASASTAAQAAKSAQPAPKAAVAAAPSPAAVVAEKKAEPPLQVAMAKPEASPPAVVATAPPGKKKLSYRDGSDLKPCPTFSPEEQVIGEVDKDAVKDIMDRIGCPQCHAYVQKKTGPPFREVLKKYKGNPACVIHRLKTNPTHNDEGVTRDIKDNEFKMIADYVASRFN